MATSLCDICLSRSYCEMERAEMPECFVPPAEEEQEDFSKCPRKIGPLTQFCAFSEDGYAHAIPPCEDCPYIKKEE